MAACYFFVAINLLSLANIFFTQIIPFTLNKVVQLIGFAFLIETITFNTFIFIMLPCIYHYSYPFDCY
jgi:hypothetical protein